MRDADATSGGRRALLIGIDRYRAAPTVPALEGCVNDVRLMRGILEEQFGFPPEQVTLLADEEATRDAILAALDALVAQTRTDDVVVIHYAGHGSQMTDREGDEASGLDNTIMPVDSEGWSGDNRDITDDELHLRLAALGRRTSYVTLIVDACHSATITRDAFGVKSRGVRADTRPIDRLPPSPLPAPAAPRGARQVGPSGWMPLASQYVLIAGCRDEETSFEYRTVGDPGVPVEALETVKLFVTTSDADFRFLEQEGTRSAGSPTASALQLLWQSAAGGAGRRDIARRRMPVDLEDWTTVMRPFVLRRSGAAQHGASPLRGVQGR
jgi:hypothetical protein